MEEIPCILAMFGKAWKVSLPTHLGRGSRVFYLLAGTILVLHAALLLGASPPNYAPLLSNLIQLSSALLAAAACLFASRRMDRFGRHFWWFVASGFFVWSFAQVICTYYENVLHASLQQPWPSDIIFFLSMVPASMTLLFDREEGFDWRQWPGIFDLTQVIIVTLAVYSFFFEMPSAWGERWIALARYAWTPDTARDLILCIAFASAAHWSKPKSARALYGRMAIFFFVYLSFELPYLYQQAEGRLQSGTLWDLGWSSPFLLITILAASSATLTGTNQNRRPGTARQEPIRQWSVVHVATILFPVVVLLMAAGIAQTQLTVALILVILSFACSVARLLLSEHQQNLAAAALAESNALLNSIFEGTGDASFLKDLQGRYVIVNEAFARMLKLTRQEIVGKNAAELLNGPDAAKVAAQDKAVLESGQLRTFEEETLVGGEPKKWLATKAPWRDANGKIVGLLGVLRDVTDYRRMEDRLRQSQKMEAIGTLAGGVAHDFNNLLTVINGYSSILADSLDNEPKLRGHLDQIQKAAERAMSLTRQLLAFSRKQTIQPTPLKLNQVVAGMEKLLHRLIGEDVLISAQLASDLGTVLADAGQMEQVILNLAVNARDAMPNGGQLTFETRNVEIGDAIASANSMAPGRYVEFLVRDTGVGMSLNVQTRLFEPFFTTKPPGKGTGLGLSTVYGILKQAGGSITFTSQPGHGTTFRIFLPRTDSAPTAVVSPNDKDGSLDGKETVLLVEDDAAVCNLVRAVLTSHGYTVICPSRPQDAEQVFEQNGGRFDLLLSDVVMPEIGGAELAKKLCAKNPSLKVLFMSGYIGDSIVRQGIQEKEVGFLQKPFAPLTLAQKVRQVLDGSRVS